jgi:hypothetical protein
MGKLTSNYLRAKDVDNLRAAILFAEQQGYPLNLTITIKWQHFDGRYNPEYRLADAQERLRHSLVRRGHGLYWLWVRESRFGAHHHLLAHDCFSDDGITFDRLLRRALKPDGGPNADNAIIIKPTGSGQVGSGGPLGWWRYIAKGMHPIEAASRHIITSPQGYVTGKRTGMTENINRAARLRALNGKPAQAV